MSKNIIESIYDVVEQQIDTFLPKITSLVSIQVPEYKSEWCNEDINSEECLDMLKAKGQFIELIIKNLLYNKEKMDIEEEKEGETDLKCTNYPEAKLEGYVEVSKKLAEETKYEAIKDAVAKGQIEVWVNDDDYIIGKQPKDSAATNMLLLTIHKVFPDLGPHKF